MKPRKHSELIKAWADGHEIQFKNDFGCWQKVDLPLWEEDVEYRIKPRMIKREGWVNLYKSSTGMAQAGYLIYETIIEADEASKADARLITTVKVEWEEEE